jgi:hypothetical protein
MHGSHTENPYHFGMAFRIGAYFFIFFLACIEPVYIAEFITSGRISLLSSNFDIGSYEILSTASKEKFDIPVRWDIDHVTRMLVF